MRKMELKWKKIKDLPDEISPGSGENIVVAVFNKKVLTGVDFSAYASVTGDGDVELQTIYEKPTHWMKFNDLWDFLGSIK